MKVQPGDIGFAHTNGVMGRLIRVGEFISLKRACEWNHMFVVSDHVDTDGTPLILQATLRGVTDDCRLDEVSPYGKFITMPPPDACDRHELLAFMKHQVGLEYSKMTILAIAIDIVTWEWFPAFRGARRSSWICSALVNEALRFAGWLHPWIDIYTVTPAQGYFALQGKVCP